MIYNNIQLKSNTKIKSHLALQETKPTSQGGSALSSPQPEHTSSLAKRFTSSECLNMSITITTIGTSFLNKEI